MKKFYSHLVEIDSLIVELEEFDLSDKQRTNLAQLLDTSVHHVVLDAILSELSEEDKIEFLSRLSEDNHDKIWEHLNRKVDNIEEKIRTAAEGLRRELQVDIREAKTNK